MSKILVLSLLILFIGCQSQAILEAPSIDIVTLSTDKPLYHSNELIKITSIINTNSVFNVSIRFFYE